MSPSDSCLRSPVGLGAYSWLLSMYSLNNLFPETGSLHDRSLLVQYKVHGHVYFSMHLTCCSIRSQLFFFFTLAISCNFKLYLTFPFSFSYHCFYSSVAIMHFIAFLCVVEAATARLPLFNVFFVFIAHEEGNLIITVLITNKG